MSASTSERVHGGLDLRELAALGVSPASVVDFSVNLNPYGPSAPVLAALQAAALDVYPDPRAHEARRAWSERLNVSPESVCVGHGASDLFWAIARARLAPGDRVVIAEPTFSEFRVAARAASAEITAHVSTHEQAFRVDIAALAATAQDARAVYLCTPNNPTGVHTAPELVVQLAHALPRCWIVLDQSFLSLSDHAHEDGAVFPANVIRVRSLTKDFALPGLRIGIAVGDPDVIARVERARPSWPTSAPALAAISAAARASGFVAESYARMRHDREAVRGLLAAHGLEPNAPAGTFTLARVGDARAFRRRMLELGVSLRDCSSFGLPDHVRVAALPNAARERLARALAEVAPAFAGACAASGAR